MSSPSIPQEIPFTNETSGVSSSFKTEAALIKPASSIGQNPKQSTEVALDRQESPEPSVSSSMINQEGTSHNAEQKGHERAEAISPETSSQMMQRLSMEQSTSGIVSTRSYNSTHPEKTLLSHNSVEGERSELKSFSQTLDRVLEQIAFQEMNPQILPPKTKTPIIPQMRSGLEENSVGTSLAAASRETSS